MAEGNTSEHLMGEAMLFDPVMQQSYLLNEFNREFQPIATIAAGAPIEFTVKASEKLYLDLNNSRLRLKLKIIKEDGADYGAQAVDVHSGPVNLLFHSLWKEVVIQLNGKTVTDPSNMYPYRAYLETLINYSREVKETRLLSEGWVADDDGDDIVASDPIAGGNAGLNTRRTMYALQSKTVELVGRLHADLFQQDKLIPPGVDMSIKLVPSDNAFVLMSNDQKPQVKILEATLIVHTKQLTEAAEVAHRELVLQQNMRLPYTKVTMKHMTIPGGASTVRFDNLFMGALPDLVLIGLLGESEFAGDHKNNPFAFRNHGLKRIEMQRNGVVVPRNGYTPDFASLQYIKDYITFQEQLGFDQGDKCVAITPEQWKDGYTIYAFKLTDGPIGSGTYGPRSRANSGSAGLLMDFTAALVNNRKVVVMAQWAAVMEFDQFNNVIIS